MKWGRRLRTAAPPVSFGCVAPTERQRSPGLRRNRISRRFFRLPSRSLSATIWISPASFQSFCLTMPRSCRSTLRHQTWPRGRQCGTERCKALTSSSLRGRWDWTAAPCRASTTLAWIRSFFPARESSRTLSAALATAMQRPCFRAILALVLRRPVAGPNHGVDRTRSDPRNGEVVMSTLENVQIVKDFFAAMGSYNERDLLALVAEDIEWIIPGEDWPLAGTHRGHAELAAVLQKASEEVEMTYPEPPEFVAQGDRVLVVGVATGKIKATNKPFKDDWVFDITVRNGKVTKIREYIDTQALARASESAASPRL